MGGTTSIGDRWQTGRGYVYFLTTATGRQALDRGDSAPVKVGKCAKPGVRLLSLQSGAPEPLEYVRLIPAANSDQAEREMHLRFKSRHLHHEWFSLALADIQGIDADLEQLSRPEIVQREIRHLAERLSASRARP